MTPAPANNTGHRPVRRTSRKINSLACRLSRYLKEGGALLNWRRLRNLSNGRMRCRH
ncbi:hypothetical protein KCP69_12200 [Salmonella enterica subsp. enterica]|nr:hypothetical protein KCP69_12200 [Salmonella enterica subsp. enterica]